MNKFKLLCFIFFFTWIFLPSTLFIFDNIKIYSKSSCDKKFYVTVYRTMVISPYSFYKYIKNEDYYFIIYNKDGTIFFKPSFFYGMSEMGAYDAMEFMYEDNNNYLYYPEKDGYHQIKLH